MITFNACSCNVRLAEGEGMAAIVPRLFKYPSYAETYTLIR